MVTALGSGFQHKISLNVTLFKNKPEELEFLYEDYTSTKRNII